MKYANLFCFVCLSAVTWAQPEPLDPAHAVEKQIQADGEHTYRFHADAGEYFYLKAKQGGLDLSFTLTGPDGKALAVVNRTTNPSVEDLHWIAGLPGDYQVAVNANKSPASGNYRLELQLRIATPADRGRFLAFTAGWIEAQSIQKEGPSSPVKQRAILKLEES